MVRISVCFLGLNPPPWFSCPRTRDTLGRLKLKEKAFPRRRAGTHPSRVHPSKKIFNYPNAGEERS